MTIRSRIRGHRWLLARRLSQGAILALFLAGPGVDVLRGSLSSSLVLGRIPLSDPLLVLQGLLASHRMAAASLAGAAIVAVLYALIAGRAYCAWVCPINLLTDAAAWTRRRLGLGSFVSLDRRLRFLVLAGVLLASAVSGEIVWEAVNPVTAIQRALLTGTLLSGGTALLFLIALILFDLVVSQAGWCGALCPMGALYALIGVRRGLRVAAVKPDACTRCGRCVARCPEPQALAPVVNGADSVVRSAVCTDCGRCMDACPEDVFRFAFMPGRRKG